MPDQGSKEIHEALQNPNDAQAHHDPFHDLRKERFLNHGPEDEANSRDDHGGNHRHSDRYSNAKCSFVHNLYLLGRAKGPPISIS